MAFWSDGNISPKLSYKWVLTLGGVDHPIAAYTIRSFQKPSFTLGVAQYININDVAYRPGILSWNPVDVNLVDAENTFENNSKILYEAAIPNMAAKLSLIKSILMGTLLNNGFCGTRLSLKPISDKRTMRPTK